MSQRHNYTLRKVTKEDNPFLYQMVYEAIFIPEGSQPPPRDIVYQPELSKYVGDFENPSDLGYIAFDETTQERVGAAWLSLLTGGNRGYGYVDDMTPELTIAVLPEYRGRGIGTALLKRLIEVGGEFYTAISLSVWRENPAYRLYRRLGFEVVNEEGPAVTMRIPLEHANRITNP